MSTTLQTIVRGIGALFMTLAAIGLGAAPLACSAKPNPCCEITSIDMNGRVTAQELVGAQRAFQFQVDDKALLGALRIGQKIWADFGTQKVSVNGAGPCCNIVSGTGSKAVTPAPAESQATPPAVKMPPILPGGPCCDIVANPALKGRMGRLLVVFPEKADAGNTRMDVYKAGEPQALAGGFGNQTLDMLPGTYAVVISGKRVEGVTVQSGHDTKVKVGVLRITAGGNTRVDLLDPATKQPLIGGFGSQQFGLPIGTVHVRVAGQSEAATIEDGKITDF
jgi:hypothetical protein